MSKEKKKIVILGGGFGGLYTYKSLLKEYSCRDVEVVIVNKTNYFLFTPLLHEVATGGVGHHQVVESLREVIYKTHTKLHVGEVTMVDCEKRIITTTNGVLEYDALVVALGATTNFFNAIGAKENTLVLKDLHDAIKIRNKLIEVFEKASEEKDEEKRKKMLSFTVIGGGATGVELVSEIADLIRETFIKYYGDTIRLSDITLSLVHAGAELLGPFHPQLQKDALRAIKNLGINVLLNSSVTEVKSDSVIMSDGKTIDSALSFWTAGVKPNIPPFAHPIETDKGGRIIVNPYLQMPNHKHVFVIGDIASLEGSDGRALPMLAQIAEKQGLHTGINIRRFFQKKDLLPFTYSSKGELASLGRWHAVANIYGVRFSGFFAWFLWRTVYLFKFLSRSKKIKIVVDWTLNIFFPRDITKA